MSLKKEICENIARLALQSLLYEVSATPKPGLVDRYNQGAHQDMDFFTFMSSSAALVFYFYECAVRGWENHERDAELFPVLREVGLEAEKAMLKATGGVNTHKGLIFSLGLICAAASNIISDQSGIVPEAATVCRKVARMTKGICQSELEAMRKQTGLTHGEKIFLQYGLTGIRGEVESGFATVRTYALPVLKELKTLNIYSLNDILAQVLLHLMAVNEDTNIVARHDRETLDYVKKYSLSALETGGMLTAPGRRMVTEMDREFIARNISPGGSADLLAVAVMLDLLCKD
jgi:triphosphoribosyl-dephospho-CoA synthase